MKKQSKTTVLVVALPVTLLCLGLGAKAASGHQSDEAKGQPSGDNTIIIDPIAGEAFTPAGAAGSTLKGVLSPVEAYRAYAGRAEEVPGNWTIEPGYLTLPLGQGTPGEYTAKDEFVYAYTVPLCAPEILPPQIAGSDAKLGGESTEQPSGAGCTRWLFVNASTGEMIDMTWTTS